jgi:hypothetical protein
LDNEYDRLKERVKMEILKAEFISFTIDAWTDEAAKRVVNQNGFSQRQN